MNVTASLCGERETMCGEQFSVSDGSTGVSGSGFAVSGERSSNSGQQSGVSGERERSPTVVSTCPLYTRRLDRTPDRNWHEIPPEDQAKISGLRRAVERVKNRMEELRAAVNDSSGCDITRNFGDSMHSIDSEGYETLLPYSLNQRTRSLDGWSSPESSVYQDLPSPARHQQAPQILSHKNGRNTEPFSQTLHMGQHNVISAEPAVSLPHPHINQIIGRHGSSFQEMPAFSGTHQAARLTDQPLHQTDQPAHQTSPSFLCHHAHLSGADLPSSLSSHYLPHLYGTDSFNCGCMKAAKPPRKFCDNISLWTRTLVDNATLRQENKKLKGKLSMMKQYKRNAAYEKECTETCKGNKEQVSNKQKPHTLKVGADATTVDGGNKDTFETIQPESKSVMSRSVQTEIVFSDTGSQTIDFEDQGSPSHQKKLSEITPEKNIRDHENGHIKYTQKMLDQQRLIMREEMQKVLDERNQARQRVKKLEKKLTLMELSAHTNRREDTLLAKLRVTETERDLVVSKLSRLTEDINETKLIYSLQKALLPVDSTSNDKSIALDAVNTSEPDTQLASTDNHHSVEVDGKINMKNKIDLLQGEKKSHVQKIEKLKQLVKLQRQKLNTLCAGPVLIDNNS